MRLWHRCFPVNLAKSLRTPFLQNTSGRLPLLLAFRSSHRSCFIKKVFLKISQNLQKNTCGWQNFQEHFFLQNTCATATLLKWSIANSVRKTLDEYSLSRNTNLKSTVQVYHFFLGSINCSVCFHSFIIFTVATRVEVFCIKSVGKHFANFIGKHLCWSLF